MDDVVAAFQMAIEQRGLAPRRLDADGHVHRCGTLQKPRSKNGAYCLYLDGKVPAGWYQNHEDGLGVTKWRSNRENVISEAERAEWRRQMQLRRDQRDKDQRTRHLAAASRARFILDRSAPAGPHPYLVRKGIKAYGAREHRGLLVLPLFNGVGGLVNLQFIAADGGKKFLTGGEKRGCFFAIGDPDYEPEGICIGEGFATMASVYRDTGYMSVVAFDCGNLLPVALLWRRKLPAARIIICADNDKAGIMAANEVVQAVPNSGIALCPEDFEA